ncbi:hypothetical protein [Pseudomonas sp. FEN]|uniref:hypothetical protein n=1 Tax=Pseudomonas sp. FEN TaxID=2767468 RepID=UPI00174AEA4E|nr:hypothetical protein [Pseudomonas sp. FEN]CAD5200966.1 putative glycine-rich protein [Pseudomonas sp. FEN]
MRIKKKTLVAAMSCVMMLAAAPLLPAELSIMASAYAKEGGGGGGGAGGNGGNGGNGGHGGESGGHSAGAKSGGRAGGLAEGQESDHDGKAVRDHGVSGAHLGTAHKTDHDGKAVRDHGVSGTHLGRAHKTDRGHGVATSSVAHAKTTKGLSKATAISDTTPGDHNDKGLGQAATSTIK